MTEVISLGREVCIYHYIAYNLEDKCSKFGKKISPMNK